MEKRPKIIVPLSPIDRIIEIAAWVLLVLCWSFSIWAYCRLPATIPIHFGVSGKPDGYGDKGTLFILPSVGTFIFALLTLLNNYPHMFNYPVEIRPENAERLYTFATKMMRLLKLMVILTFTSIGCSTYLTTLGVNGGISSWVEPLVFILVFIPTGYYTTKMLKNK